MQNAEQAGETASAILEHAGDGIIDELIGSASPATIPAIRPAVFRRASSPLRWTTYRARDYRLVLPWLLDAQEVEKARDALEFLEFAANDRIGNTEFVELLQTG